MRTNRGSRIAARSVALALAGLAAAGCASQATEPHAAGPVPAAAGTRDGGPQERHDRPAAGPVRDAVDVERVLSPGGQEGWTWASMEQYMDYALSEIHGYWSQVESGYGRPAPTVNYLWQQPGTVRASGCGGTTGDLTMHYCPSEDAIIFSLSAATQIWEGTFQAADGKHGGGLVDDFGVAYLIAHEYAHNMQSEYGLRAVHEAASDPETQRRIGLALERHADCWAGSWASSAYYAGTLEPTDLEEAQRTAWVIADTRPDHQRSHGDTEERPADFMYGYNSVDPRACDALLQF